MCACFLNLIHDVVVKSVEKPTLGFVFTYAFPNEIDWIYLPLSLSMDSSKSFAPYISRIHPLEPVSLYHEKADQSTKTVRHFVVWRFLILLIAHPKFVHSVEFCGTYIPRLEIRVVITNPFSKMSGFLEEILVLFGEW